MNLIEQLGGYENAKSERDNINYRLSSGDFLGSGSPREYLYERLNLIETDLLEHRRANNIFEVGDKVVFRECSGIGGASDAIDLMTVKSIDAFGVRMTNSLCPWAIQIRHATDAEIAAGKRL